MAPKSLTRVAAVLASGVLALALAACGSDDGDHHEGASPSETMTASNGDVFNGADVAFATDMIPHHAQAIEMVTLADGRTLDPEVRALADAIRDAQAPEVETMVDWLTAWGQEVPETSLDHSNAHGSGHDMSHDMPGMMSAEDMDALAAASDADFQRLWLEMMVEHHQGALEMAVTEQEDGLFPDAVALAASIEDAQRAEIEQMEGLLDS